jgi:outer membrane lipoprotein-sorting protein
VDAVIQRGVAQLQAEPVSPQGLAQTLGALGLRSIDEDRFGGRRPRGSARVVAGRMAVGTVLAALGVALALTFFSHTETAVFAQTFAALRKVRSYHWTGVQVLHGRPQRWEMWYSSGRSREQIGDQTIVNDGDHQRSYKAGSGVVIVDRSFPAGNNRMTQLLQPGGFLSRIEAMRHDPGCPIRVEERTSRTPDGRAVQRFEIATAAAGNGQRTDPPQGRMTFLVDPDTKLPVGWTVYELREGRWRLSLRIDRFEYNTPIPGQLFDLKLPAGTPAVVVDHSTREQAQLAAQTTPRGWKIILRAIDRTREGDVMVSVSQVPPGHDRSQPDPVPLKEILDDRGTVYADTHNDYMAGTYTMFWLVSPSPPGSNGSWPQRFTLTVQVEDGENVTFRNIAAPPPAFESVLQLLPDRDPDEVETIRAGARARLHQGEQSGPGHSGSSPGAPARRLNGVVKDARRSYLPPR